MFTGIGEFSIHKEFVWAKVAGNVASLRSTSPSRRYKVGFVIGCEVESLASIAFLDKEGFMAIKNKVVVSDHHRSHQESVAIWIIDR